ncbi:hypothetical protein HNQ51_000193 [Inhella inkyongensis]|uniref:Solute-binding protein family 3/N-terminal domain-containing protein n=1 Tax=Inhella inkyongensis TaxID=392593 RepID=A0A840S2T8_9BURK|nr:hypothetical protein [Inhella inkyongensis]MBB5202900.1 hypothetical protein [Inhella inkyongensis]
MPANRRTACASLLGAAWGAARAQPLTIRMAVGRDDNDHRFDYALALLRLALQAAGFAHELVTVPGLTQTRRARELVDGNLDVALLPTVNVDPNGLQPIRRPIRRGLLGVRLLLAHRRLAPRLAAITQLSTLKKQYRLGYGADWGDLPLQQRLGFQVVTGSDYSGLFKMLALGRFDYMSRGVNEVWAEVDHPLLVPPEIVVVPRIALTYPLDDYFWVSARQPALHRALAEGLARLESDGRFQRLFLQFHGRGIERAEMPKRRILPVLGYGVDPETPMDAFDVLELDPSQGRLRASS